MKRYYKYLFSLQMKYILSYFYLPFKLLYINYKRYLVGIQDNCRCTIKFLENSKYTVEACLYLSKYL